MNKPSLPAECVTKRKPANPCVLVIFGIAGDLTKRLLLPAICNLGCQGLLPENFCIVGFSKENFDTNSFHKQLLQDFDEFIPEASAKKYARKLINNIYYICGDFDNSKDYQLLKKKLEELTQEKNASKNVLFYLAAPPDFVKPIATHLDKAGLLTETKEHFRRIVIEKPFGHDLASAKKLNKLLLSLVNEKQIFRIDHFLGKETVQNLLAFRFSNGLFEPTWNNLYIDNVQITVAETLGVEQRGSYYEHAGALRDMIASHAFQMLSLIVMEPPSSFSQKNIDAEKLKALRAVQILTPEQVLSQTVRGQYGPGKIKGVAVPGYREEPHVSKHSNVETYIALKLHLDNWRWLHVPFYIRTGKRMPVRQTAIVVQFKSGPSTLFETLEHFKTKSQKVLPNILRINIQPEEGISLSFNAKIPGPELRIEQVNMTFKYEDYFGMKPQTGYETILYDCMNGDHLLFKRAEMVELGWELVQPILDVWGALPPRDFPNYAAGTWGPKQADKLLTKDRRKWIL